MEDFKNKGLGRRKSHTDEHIEKYPFSAVAPATVADVEKLFILPTWHKRHNQGREGACVGFGTSMMLTILNENQVRAQGQRNPYIRYNPWWLWDRAKEIDVWPDTNPGDDNGTSVRAACEILNKRGHVIWINEGSKKSIGPESAAYGIKTYRWATSVDQMRTALSTGVPLSIGVNWYTDFYKPVFRGGEYWIGLNSEKLGNIEGGHCVCIYGASDKRQAFRIKNSWGSSYPEVWIPYKTMERLIHEDGEVALITDH